MESNEDHRTRYRLWKERCECPSKGEDDFMQCRCGMARKAGLVCEVCEAELVVRYSKTTNAPFWACVNFSRTNCEFTRRIQLPNNNAQSPSSSTQEVRTPSKHSGTKRPAKLVTPNSPQSDTDSNSRTTPYHPKQLFPPNEKKLDLKDTFVGEDLAAALIECGRVPAFVYSSSSPEKSSAGVAQQSKLYYAENRRSDEFCISYWYSEIDQKCPGMAEEKSKPIVLELFAGAGGMSLGLSQAGFDVKFAVEKDVAAADTLRSNHKNMVVFQQGVRDFLDDTKPKGPCSFCPEEIDHLQASPPCQSYSQAKQSCFSTTKDKQNNDLIHEFPKGIGLVRPKTALLENVDGIFSSPSKNRYLQEVVAELLKMQYQVRVAVLNAADYGDPQERHRLFLFAAKQGFPLPQVPQAYDSYSSIYRR